MEALQKLLEDVDFLISQHAIYISQVEKYIRKGRILQPKDCHSCQLGLLMESINEDNLPEDIKELIKDIKSLHCKFHEKAEEAFKTKDENILQEVNDISAELFRQLLRLKTLSKSLVSLN